MKRIGQIGLLTVAILGGVATQASAKQGFWEVLEALSGPGPFHGGGAALAIVCGTSTSPVAREEPGTAYGWQCWDTRGGQQAKRRYYRWAGELRVARYASRDNLPAFAPGTFDNDDQRKHDVVWWQFGFFLNWPVTRYLDMGAGASANVFGSRRDVFDTFVKPSVSVLELRWHPINRGHWGILTGQFGVDVLFGPFDAVDFGALDGTFHSGTELRARGGLVVDLRRW
ncbi:MAG: hypothetical protein AB7I50_17335 [Vicinamibacterales bacterium]